MSAPSPYVCFAHSNHVKWKSESRIRLTAPRVAGYEKRYCCCLMILFVISYIYSFGTTIKVSWSTKAKREGEKQEKLPRIKLPEGCMKNHSVTNGSLSVLSRFSPSFASSPSFHSCFLCFFFFAFSSRMCVMWKGGAWIGIYNEEGSYTTWEWARTGKKIVFYSGHFLLVLLSSLQRKDRVNWKYK